MLTIPNKLSFIIFACLEMSVVSASEYSINRSESDRTSNGEVAIRENDTKNGRLLMRNSIKDRTEENEFEDFRYNKRARLLCEAVSKNRSQKEINEAASKIISLCEERPIYIKPKIAQSYQKAKNERNSDGKTKDLLCKTWLKIYEKVKEL